MKWINDSTGRFQKRPYFEEEELNYECESVMHSFLEGKYGSISYPISTNDLIILIEQKTSLLDQFADLSTEGNDVEGMTVFVPGEKPKVYVTQRLSENPNAENRLRTTLGHEFGHVLFHNFLQVDNQLSFFDTQNQSSLSIKCHRDNIINAKKIDWMEWQAGFASGAFLMPITTIRAIVQNVFETNNLPSKQTLMSPAGQEILQEVKTTFQVSGEAAKVRLLQLGFLTEKVLPQPLMQFN